MLGGELTRLEPPTPASLRLAGRVHPRLAPESEDILRLDDREAGVRAVSELDERPVRFVGLDAGMDESSTGAFAGHVVERAPPAERRVVVV